MDAPLEVSLLGPLEVRLGGTVVALPSRRQRTLLARLALSPGRAVPAAHLVDVMWGDDPPAGATANLHTYVSRLRAAIGRERVWSGPGGYRLEVPPQAVDVGRAEELDRRATGTATGDPAEAARLLGLALDLWRGEPLADLADPLPFLPDLTRLQEWRLQLVERRAELLLRVGRAAEVLPQLHAEAVREPTREGLQLLLMRALDGAGRTPEALGVGRQLRRRLAEETGLDPSGALDRLEQRLLAGEPPPAGPAREPAPEPARDPVPAAGRRPRLAPANRFVGREAELAQLREAVAAHRVVTVVGPGGVGKTRLVSELVDAGTDVDSHFSQLAPVTAEDDVAEVVAAGMGLRNAPSGVLAALADRIGDRSTVLVLDNCEHVLAATAELVQQLLARCPDLRVLATSRRRLAVPGELVVRLSPLAPEAQAELFRDRAALLRPGFHGSDETVAEVCRLVDGLPLALELAAGRESVFGLEQLRERLAAGLLALGPRGTGGGPDAMTAASEWSYQLLDPQAQALFDALSVCSGGFSIEALDHLGPGGSAGAGLLAELVEASMVVPDLSADPPRYRVLEPMRQVGEAHLDGTARRQAEDAHASWMLAHAHRVRALQDRRSPLAGPALTLESANLRSALARLLDARSWDRAADLGVPLVLAVSDDVGLDVLGVLRRFADVRPDDEQDAARCALVGGGAAWAGGDPATAAPLLDAAVASLPREHPDRWAAVFFRSMNRMYTGDAVGVAADTDELLDSPGTPAWVRATAVCDTALIHQFTGRPATAARRLEQHRALLDDVGRVDGFVAYTRGELVADEDPELALRCFDEAYERSAAAGHAYNREVAAVARSAVLTRLGRWDEAVVQCWRNLSALLGCGMRTQLWTQLRLSAELLAATGEYGTAALVLAAADADTAAPAVLGADVGRDRRIRAAIEAALTAEELRATRDRGVRLGPAAVVGEVLQVLARVPVTAERTAPSEA